MAFNIQDYIKQKDENDNDNQSLAQFHEEALEIEKSFALEGTAHLTGAKNAVLVIMASCILTDGKSVLYNVPYSQDVLQMITLLQDLGAEILFDKRNHRLEIDASSINSFTVRPEIMKKMRASILVMGPLLARFSRADIALPGGCLIGSRPIDFHLKNFKKMGVQLRTAHEFITAEVHQLQSCSLVLDYPSVGATENIIMAAVAAQGTTRIVNAALEPEVLDLITVLKKMGAHIAIRPPSVIEIEGVQSFKAVDHDILVDRLEAGSLLLATAITGGTISLPEARWDHLDVFLLKLEQMGHTLKRGNNGKGIQLKATLNPKAVSFTTGPYPSFPTDLQAPMMVAQTIAEGKSVIHETVFENRLLHVRELQKMGAQISINGDKAIVTGVDELYGAHVIATDIRAACALALAGLVAKGKTVMTGMQHWRRGYELLEKKLSALGARITLKTTR